MSKDQADFTGPTPGPWTIEYQFNVYGNGERSVCSTGRYSSARESDRGYAENVANAQRIVLCVNNFDALVEALKAAEHALVTIQGCYATDIAPENREALIANGSQIEWQIDDAKTLDQIRALLAKCEPVKNQDSNSPSPSLREMGE